MRNQPKAPRPATTALEQMKTMLDGASVSYRVSPVRDGEVEVTIEACAGDNNGGIEGATATFVFDADSGSLLATATWDSPRDAEQVFEHVA